MDEEDGGLRGGLGIWRIGYVGGEVGESCFASLGGTVPFEGLEAAVGSCHFGD